MSNATVQKSAETSPEVSIRDWVTIEDFCKLFPNIPEKTIRWQMTSRNKNGLASAVQVIGRQLLISVERYSYWLNQRA